MPTRFEQPRAELPTSPLQLRDFPLSVERRNADIRPNYDRNVPHNQRPLESEDRPAPQRIERKYVDPTVRLDQVAEELTDALALADSAPVTYAAELNAPPTDEKEKAEAKVRKLAQQLQEAQAELDEINNRPTPLESFTDSAVKLETNVQFLAGTAHTALVDLSVKETFGVDREDAADEVLYTFGRKFKRLQNYQRFQSLHRAVSSNTISELLVANSVKRSKAALQVIAEVLKENRTNE
ncbi:MAG TPA: hypothetical protein VNY04_02875 [Chthoniobacterales bacterium]|jgi:hypothetical protein|nr:hypothetical protein [Chthoniobacterales bacterium]